MSEHTALLPPRTYDDYYTALRVRLRRQVATWQARNPHGAHYKHLGPLVEQLLFLPDLFHLSVRLVFDGSVPARRKGALIAGIAYVVAPFDIIPDIIPVLGWLDDLVVLTLALNSFLATDDPAMKAAIDKHWAGDRDLFVLTKHVLEVLEAAIEFLPNQLIKLLKPIFASR